MTSTPVPPTSISSLTATFTKSPTVTATPTITATPTPLPPLTIVFYGDSLLRVGEVGHEAKYSFSFVDDLRPILEPHYVLVTANYGGKEAKWAYENLNQNVLASNPDIVTIWWGFMICSVARGFSTGRQIMSFRQNSIGLWRKTSNICKSKSMRCSVRGWKST